MTLPKVVSHLIEQFQRLPGIGPKTALNILSGMNATAFRDAMAGGDVKSLSQISGVGKKTAERIVELLRDEKLRNRLGQEAHETVRKRFLMIRYLEDYLDLIGSFETLYRFRPGRGMSE